MYPPEAASQLFDMNKKRGATFWVAPRLLMI